MAGHSIASGPIDPGAQNERTSLAWTRTALALLVGVILVSRITVEDLGITAVVFGIAVAPLAILVVLLAGRRYRAAHSALQTRRALPDGRLPALVTAVVLLLAILEMAYAIVA